MINITINAEPVQTRSRFVSDVLIEYGARPPFAVALNGEFVPQSQYQQQVLNEGDLLDIVAPIFGG